MNPDSLIQSYSYLRAEDAVKMRTLLSDLPDTDHLLEHVFWTNALADTDGSLRTFYAPLPEKEKFNAASFDTADTLPVIEKCGKFRRLRVTTHRVLNLGAFDGEESFFAALSQKNRKKLRWLRNTMPKLGCRVVPLETEEDFKLFEKLYCVQFPKYTPGGVDNQAVWRIYQIFIAQKRSFSFLLLDENGEPLAAALGYFNGKSYNYTHLTRSKGEYDKYSPGYYLTYCILMRILSEHPETEYFFMGPGEYDYKRAFLGVPFAIYRYVRSGVLNLPALLRLAFRCRKEQKNFRAQ